MWYVPPPPPYLEGIPADPPQAKSAIAPLDRVKILFQTSNADFRKFAGKSSLPCTHVRPRLWARGVQECSLTYRHTHGAAARHRADLLDAGRGGALPGPLDDAVAGVPIRGHQVHGVRLARGGASKLRRGCVASESFADRMQIIIPTPDKRTPGRFFLAGAMSGEERSNQPRNIG